MKLRYFKGIIFLILLILSSCKEEESGSDIEIINIENAIGKGEKINLSSISDSIYYLKLETDSSCLLDKIRSPYKNIVFKGNRIFVSDTKNLYCFDSNGNYLYKVGGLGRGPGEYGDVLSFTVLNEIKKIAILSETRRNVFIYDFNGNFKNKINVDFYPTNIASIGNRILLVNCKGRRELIDYYTFSIYTTEGDLLKRVFKRDNERKAKLRLDSDKDRFFYFKNTLHYWEFYYDTIWRINNNTEIEAVSYINYGKDKLPFEYLYEERNYETKDIFNYKSLWSILETKDYVFINFDNKGKQNSLLYDRSTLNTLNLRFNREKNGYFFSLFNDIDHGMNFWPDGIVSATSVFSVVYGYEIKRKVATNPDLKFSEDIIKIASNAKISDNPILMIVNLK